MGTDADWGDWGRRDPYYGVLTHDRYRTAQLTEEGLRDFFKSGTDQVDYILGTARRHLDEGFRPRSVLDFGCGTGRLLVPFAGMSEAVTGVDVSDGMLEEASRNCRRRNVTNVSLLKSDDDLARLSGSFDLVHSVIVFQHIPPTRGLRLFARLIEHIADGGVGAIQITYSDGEECRRPVRARLGRIRKGLGRFKRRVMRTVRGGDPEMQMNAYCMNALLLRMQSAGVRAFFAEFTDHGGHRGTYLFFQKPRAS